MLTSFPMKPAFLANPDYKINDTRILDVIKECKKIQVCIEPTCFPEVTKNTMAIACIGIEIQNTEYTKCGMQLNNMTDFSNYDCLEGADFDSEEFTDVMFTSKKECTKTIMRDVCGKNSLVDFDRAAELNMKLTRLSAAIYKELIPEGDTE
uniref:DUF19 domain-containing protein n=1 Tax=Caenorhabditis tropicalis TaxID=1561998 RepID=A0A1I7V2C1_9PELO